MTTIVTGKNQITIPAQVARKLGIHRGSRLEWKISESRREAILKVEPSRGELAVALTGALRKYGTPGEDWVKELIEERVRDDRECDHSGESNQ